MSPISDVDVWSRRVAADASITGRDLSDAIAMIEHQLETIRRTGAPVPIDLLYALRIVESATLLRARRAVP